jgi:hypothetical protein
VLQGPRYGEKGEGYEESGVSTVNTAYLPSVMMISLLCFPMFEFSFIKMENKCTFLLTGHQFLFYAIMISATSFSVILKQNFVLYICTVHFLCSLSLIMFL